MKSKERLDVLPNGLYGVWQADDVFCYTMDSVLLAEFVSLRNNARVLELGSGTGAISLMIKGRGAKQVVGLELNPRLVELFTRSIEYNELQEQVQCLHMDIKNISEVVRLGTFDLVVANPPYRKKTTGRMRKPESAAPACHELTAELEDFIALAPRILRTRGRLGMVNLPERLTDTLELCRKYKLEPKRLQFVHSNLEGPARLFLLEATYNVQACGLEILQPLIVYNQNGEYTEQLKDIYRLMK